MNELIYGNSPLTHIVSVEVQDTHAEIFFERDGIVSSRFYENQCWALTPFATKSSERLDGDLHYKHITKFKSIEQYFNFKKWCYNKNVDFYTMHNLKEAALVINGASYYKGMKIEDISTLSFDIETTGLVHNKDSRVILITNTFRKQGKLTRKLFCCMDYENDADMFDDWCSWVREVDPSVMLGHNIFSYDLPYLSYCADRAGTQLHLGRDESVLQFAKNASKFRKDQSQFYEYFKCSIYGRELIDTFFLSIKYDISRKYISYGLKSIIKQEGMEQKDRVFYDAGTIKDNYKVPEELKKIKAYAESDADDSLKLYDLMIPPFFYMTNSVPKPFQAMLETNSGGQINSIMVRSYLQQSHSIPKADEAEKFEGAISFAIPGIFNNVIKIDFANLYPAIMREYKVYDEKKDPLKHFLSLVEYFAEFRLKYKKLYKETGEKYYDDMQSAIKIIANSCYGFLGTNGINFNSPSNAAFVTAKGRELLKQTIKWATGKEYETFLPQEEVLNESP